MTKFLYNLKKDDHDDHDFTYSSKLQSAVPAAFDLRSTQFIPPIDDQGNFGACVSNEVAEAARFCIRKEHGRDYALSRLFIYYFGRLLDGSPLDQDTGITIRSGLKAVARYGAPKEDWFPYTRSNLFRQPSKEAMNAGLQHVKGFTYLRVGQTVDTIKQSITEGYPVLLGIQVYSSFESNTTLSSGLIPVPNTSAESWLGGHCVALYGYDDATQTFIMMNSWGVNVGVNGWFQIPYDYVANGALASDLWTIRYFR